ncbi:DUF6950 family protein [Ancylobacter sp. VNQ12]|uniref:DUF6950 family protein n=1 Tax=Ancylobacter sp. VNQ12 TaxID=3400920 RepID=UPI003C0A832D
MKLAEFLRDGATRRFEWGVCDCCIWACSWVLARRGVDPSAPWRGRYKTARGAMRHVRKGGDFVDVVSRAMADAGLVETVYPQIGDVGVVLTPLGASLAVRTYTGWAGKSERGVVVAPYALVKAWTV